MKILVIATTAILLASTAQAGPLTLNSSGDPTNMQTDRGYTDRQQQRSYDDRNTYGGADRYGQPRSHNDPYNPYSNPTNDADNTYNNPADDPYNPYSSY